MGTKVTEVAHAQGGRDVGSSVVTATEDFGRRRIFGYKVSPMSRGDVERKAADVRRALGIDPLLPLPGVPLFEGVRRYTVDVKKRRIGLTYGVEQELPDGALAAATYSEAADEISILLSDASYRDLERDGGRARFSVAHEIGHAVLHAEKLIEITRIDHNRRIMLRSDSKATPVYKDSEWQANKFGAAILMPAPGLEFLLLRGSLNTSALQEMYGVSTICAKRRIDEFNRDQRTLLIGWN
jgi:hypothetical protein